MKKLTLLILLSILGFAIKAQTIEKMYHFENPTISKLMGYDVISFEGSMQSAGVGCPSLPWQSVSLLLPNGTEAASMKVELSDFQELDGVYNLYPKQMDLPYSQAEKFVFTKNDAVYASNEIYPSNNEGNLSTNFKNGYGFAFSAFTPVRYVPATGKVEFARTAKVTINVSNSKSDHSVMLKNTTSVKESVRRLAQNPEMMATYETRELTFDGYDILIVTGNQYVEGFDEYVDYYNSIGWRTHITTIEEVCSSMEGRDNAERLRNYVIREYQNNGISTLILGGDIDIVPYRGLYCYVSDEYEDWSIPADLYFAGLDGTWNDDGDNRWGEIGEDDLLPEIGVARLPFNNAQQQNNMIHKTLSYQQNPVLGEFQHITFGSEWMSDTGPTYGSQYLYMAVGYHDEHGYTTNGIPETYYFNVVDELTGANIGSDLMAAINLGGQYTHHAGHANSNYVAGWYNWDITDSNFSQVNGVTHNYTFFFSHGCIAGAFDEDCIMERMVTIQNFCVAAIGNSRYGWFSPGTTDGPSAHLHREMTDAQYTEKMPNLALALTEAKVQTAPWVNAINGENAALRWNFYDINVIGDGAVAPWLDEPMDVTVNCTDALTLGTTSMEVQLYNDDNDVLYGFRCSLFADNQLIGYGVTDEDNVANIVFNEPLNHEGELRLVVTGQNAWPQTKTISSQMMTTPYIIYDDHTANVGDGTIDYGDDLTFNVTVKNYGAADAQNVTATLTTDDEFVEILNPTATIANIGSLGTFEMEDVFEVTVAKTIPDQHHVEFALECTDGTDVWTSSFGITANAPAFDLVNVDIEDGGDGQLQPGESAVLHFTVRNNGHSDMENVNFAIYNSHPEIENGDDEFAFESVAAGGEFTVDYEVTLSPDIAEGVNYELITCTYSTGTQFFGSYAIAVGHSSEDFETGDFSAFQWQNDEDYPWTVVTENPHGGTYCAKSAPIPDNLKSVLLIEVDVYGNDQITFFKKVSSEQGWDKFFFYIDDEMMGEWSGNVNWSRSAFDITYGHHQLRWFYAKDGATTSGDDCAWLDDITLPPTATITDIYSYSEDDFGIYPNPNNGRFVLNLDDNQNVVKIFNSLGQMVYENENAPQNLNVDISEKGSGIYLININGKTQKIIIK